MDSPPSTTEKWTANAVRTAFIDYFKNKDHEYVPSSSVVPHEDPTLLFANAGMNQFKPLFLGTSDPNTDLGKLKRACNTQKCIRAGGKHNDLEDVGKDVYHHTFFEMLGNWSFGDYFKREAIQHAWVLLTEVYGLEKERLYITYFGGDSQQGLEADEEAKNLWLELGVPQNRIIPFGTKDNFWEMGEVGPCGPCSEIHYDRIGGRDASHLVNYDDPDVLEIWNLVFMQYNRESKTELKLLPNKHIDTGMGFERLVSVLQNKPSNYDTDVFVPIFLAIQEKSGARPYTGKVGDEDVDGIDMAYRVIADHTRTLLFSISDGAVPSNEGRGYVVRRILRRGARYARKKFGVELGNFFPSLVDVVVAQMAHEFPSISKKVEYVKQILQDEEKSFSRTLDRGEKLFESTLSKMKLSNQKIVPGAEVWRLYDTFGFPVDLTRIMAEESSVTIDEQEFEREQARSKELSRRKKNAGANAGSVTLDVHAIAELDSKGNIPKTDDIYKFNEPEITAKVVALYSNKTFVQSEDSSEEKFNENALTIGVLLDKTNFYAEAGGQEWDTGYLLSEDRQTEFSVTQVKNYGGYILHVGTLKSGVIKVGDTMQCSYDELRRTPIRSNHSATHILNFSLRKILNSNEVDQRGSLVAPDKLRFDYSWGGQITPEQIKEIQDHTLSVIKDDLTVYSKEINLQDAKAIYGLRAVFGETYPNPVRVISIGANLGDVLKDHSNPDWYNYSIELCGGTHVNKTSEIGNFIVTEESSISKGIRRIVAVTGEDAAKVQIESERFSEVLNDLKKLKGGQLEAGIKKVGKDLDNLYTGVWLKHLLRQEYNQIRKNYIEADKEAKLAASKFVTNEVISSIEKNPDSDYHVLVINFDESSSTNSKALANAITHAKSLNTKAVYLISPDKTTKKVAHLCFVPQSLISKGLSAKKWASTVSEVVGGKSGGKDDSAQGSGINVDSVSEAEKVALEFAKISLS
ncbi:hypothetical protein BB559_000336 [Furculomyces boomerangus]|uniref:Alanine--tRNA ligase n=2 Tax=Harpellales TaxID=61421 RepID=A0A2T9Z5J2_9FUNG|nr:hypothetical protein BB559_000336 [Furculomyces boomerangus]PVZ99981.1 hypothetical protein BB558_003989 [Smittium angustum]